MATGASAAGLWLAVVLSGLYHGANPAMGWPLAVAAGMMGRGRRDLVRALGPLVLGHFAAMLAVLLPFALVLALVTWQREIRLAAALLVVGFGVFRLLVRRHPRRLARIRPGQLALFAFAVALAHGAGLMLLPVWLGLCGPAEAADHAAAAELMRRGIGIAVAVAAVHALAMVATGGALALAVHDWLGLRFMTRNWLDLDAVWAWSLILVGGLALALAWPG